ncbi:MAG: DUF4089 domain-containing protein [Rhodospirillales bacterium 70-18]|nr:DUF4089 domain-containing protein [Rhodospirillales bacterium]OJY78368.1 MAG: DUF4089 domain-containing protein [Rhodospirillales bacterium 70-18]
MTDQDLDAMIDAAARALGIAIQPGWRAAVRANLVVNLRMADAVLSFPLADEAEPAPVFTA